MTSLIAKAPAKINLFLHITGQRPDGYHTLQTLFQFLDYCDELTFSIRNDNKINLIAELPTVPTEENIIWRAAKLLQKTTQCKFGADIKLKKIIPMGGGLGGGSSDAATTLLALNHLWQTNLSKQQLAELGLQLGADVPVFIHGKAAFAEGIGEHLQFITLPEPWYLVLVPECQVNTAEIYRAPELTRNTAPITIRELLSRGGHNDCEAVVRNRYSAVAQALDWLAQYAPAKMTGTGACVFASFDTQQQALAVAAQAPKHLHSFVARGLNASPCNIGV
jgi:4-diphosphocytidyl-2-C-methyl-D-erythritol kinase